MHFGPEPKQAEKLQDRLLEMYHGEIRPLPVQNLSLQSRHRSFHVTIPIEWLRKTGILNEDKRKITAYFDEDLGIVVYDLQGVLSNE